MSALRRIDIAPFAGRYKATGKSAGSKPVLQWTAIALLRVDPAYQREVLRAGEKNILNIAMNFEWAKFTPVIVADIGDGLFAIIDGQHRTIAAALRGMNDVPCQVVEADPRKQAEAFVAVNGNVTAMTKLQLHVARVAAGEPRALQLDEVCASAGVTICRYPVPGNKMKPGETLAVGSLQTLFEKYGRETLIAALSCITRTRKGNPGMIRAAIVEALCVNLEAEPAWSTDLPKLIFAMQTFDFVVSFNTARATALTEGCTITSALVDAIGEHLEEKMAVVAA